MQLAGLLLASFASMAASASAQPAPSNSSVPSEPIPTNSSHVDQYRISMCILPDYSIRNGWWYNKRTSGLGYLCKDRKWIMLNTYRSGGTENVHWKYTDDETDIDCLYDWWYYDEDGTTLIATVGGRTTLERDTRRWCALRVYRSGGVESYQWAYCICTPW